MKAKKLTIAEQKLVASKVKGKTHAQAYDDAYNPPSTTKHTTKVANTSKILRREHVQRAIEQALEANEMSPNYLVSKMKEVIEQNKEVGAKRLAIKDGLELHGWKRGDRPNITLEVENASFFNTQRKIVEADQ